MLTRLSDSLTEKVRKHLVESLVISRLTYGISIWGNTTANYLKKSQIFLNLAARLVTGAEKTTSVKELMRRCDWLNMEWNTIP